MTNDNVAWWMVEPEDEVGVANLSGDGERLARLDRLARCVLSAAPVDLSCAECRVRMPALDAAARLGSGGASPDPDPRLAAAAAHVLRCAYCAEELISLSEVMSAVAARQLPEVYGAVLDLSFLAEPLVAWTALPDSLRRLAGEVRIAIGEAAAHFLDAPGLPAAGPAALPALRDGGDDAGGEVGQVLVLPDAAADLTIRLTVGPATGGRAAVALTLGRLEGGDPLPDTRVVLYDGKERLLASATTESDGSALFRDLVIGRYLVEVRRGPERWRLPLVVSGAG
jgi:hypothetical protein